MPNAQHYRDAAARFRTLADHYLRQAALVSAWPTAGHLGSGPAADAVVGALDRSAAHLRDAGEAMARLARVCEHRAVVCDEYRRRVREHDLLDVILRFLVPRPAPPYPWVAA
jgi:hypothetical protein